jgi:spermidine synthase
MTEAHRQSAADSYASRFLPLLLILFAGSGCSALIYEIVWYQLLELIIGSTAISLGVLLATFMGGLCLGCIALPHIVAARRRHPLAVYAAIEMLVGFCGILILFGMPLVNRIYVAAVGHGLPAILLRATICSMCLLPPTMLMGASLPAISRWISTTPRGASRLGLLYGANTLGAVFGCLLAGFYLLRVFNVAAATYVAAAINAAVALASLSLAIRTPNRLAENSLSKDSPAVTRNVWPVYVTVALSGGCALGAEVVWTRLLGLTLGATVYTFSIILAVFLAGLAIGSGAGSLLCPAVRPQTAIGYCQLLLTVAIAWTAFTLAKSVPYWPIDPKLSTNPWFTFQMDVLRAIWALLPPTLLWGTSFPLALAAVASRDEEPARTVGAVYAANTSGAIVGALAFSMFLIPRIGTRQSERALIVLSGVSALCVLFPAIGSQRLKAGVLRLAASMVIVGFLAAGIPAVPAAVIAYGRLVTIAGDSRILYAGEGMNSSIAISQFGSELQFHVSGKVEASNGAYDMRVQRMLGDIPAVLHRKPRSVLVVGFGAGVTAGSFVVNPDVQRIVVCEIEPLVPPTTTRYFAKENNNVLNDWRTEVVFEDARSYILTTPEKFDIITSDPIHPWVKGSATLYTKEYFELAKEHLNPGGIVTQWVPLYETDMDTVKSEIATFFDVFPDGTIWANQGDGEGYDVMLLGQTGPTTINVDELQERLNRPEYARVAKSLSDVGLKSAAEILATYAGQGPDLKPWLNGAEINRDSNLRLQYLAGLAVNSNREEIIYNEMLRYRRFPVHLIVGSDEYVTMFRLQHAWEY